MRALNRLLPWVAFAALLAVSCSPQSGSETASGAEAPSLVVRNDRLFVPARINGHEVEALLDSGAEITLIDTAYAEEIGLITAGAETARGTGGSQEATFAEGVTVEAAGVVLEDRTVAVLDLSGVAARLIGGPLPVIVGREVFDAARLEIDIDGGRIAAVDRSAEPAGVKLSMKTHRGLQTIPVSVENDEPVQADFDLGNGSDMLIGAAYAARAGLAGPERIVGKKAGGGIGGEVERDLVRLSSLEIAGRVFTDVDAAIDSTPTAADANVGVRVLRHFVMTVDFAENTVWLAER